MGNIRPSPTSRRLAALTPLLCTILCCIIYPHLARVNDGSNASHSRNVDMPPTSAFLTILPMAHAFTNTVRITPPRVFDTRLYSLKPAAIPLMDSGKALARSGELLIDLTTSLDLYGGSLSAAGANIRNCGDCLAQAAASCRFKTAAELVIDELRESADCLREGGSKLLSAVEESAVDGDRALGEGIDGMIAPMGRASACLEAAGASVMQRESVDVLGRHLVSCGEAMELLSVKVGVLDPSREEAKLSAQRMLYASQQMIVAGKELTGEKEEKPKGKSWLKG